MGVEEKPEPPSANGAAPLYITLLFRFVEKRRNIHLKAA